MLERCGICFKIVLCNTDTHWVMLDIEFCTTYLEQTERLTIQRVVKCQKASSLRWLTRGITKLYRRAHCLPMHTIIAQACKCQKQNQSFASSHCSWGPSLARTRAVLVSLICTHRRFLNVAYYSLSYRFQKCHACSISRVAHEPRNLY